MHLPHHCRIQFSLYVGKKYRLGIYMKFNSDQIFAHEIHLPSSETFTLAPPLLNNAQLRYEER